MSVCLDKLKKWMREYVTTRIHKIETCDGPLGDRAVATCEYVDSKIGEGSGGASYVNCSDEPLANGAAVVDCVEYSSRNTIINNTITAIDNRITKLENGGNVVAPYVDCEGNALGIGTKIVTCSIYSANKENTDTRLDQLEALGFLDLRNCSNEPLQDGDMLVDCTTHANDIASVEARIDAIYIPPAYGLMNCALEPIISGTMVPTCFEFNGAIGNITNRLDETNSKLALVDERVFVLEQNSTSYSLLNCNFDPIPTGGMVVDCQQYSTDMSGVDSRLNAVTTSVQETNSKVTAVTSRVTTLENRQQWCTQGGGYKALVTTSSNLFVGLALGVATVASDATENICIGYSVDIGSKALGNVVVGTQASVDTESLLNTVVGHSASVTGGAEYGVALGTTARIERNSSNPTATTEHAIAIGGTVRAKYAIAVGFESVAEEPYTFSLGSTAANDVRIVHIADGIADSDAATVGQLHRALRTSSTGSTLTANTATTISHALGRVPNIVIYKWRFTSAFAGYAVDAEIDVPSFMETTNSNNTYGIHVEFVSGTQIKVWAASLGIRSAIIPTTGGSPVSVPFSSGRLIAVLI